MNRSEFFSQIKKDLVQTVKEIVSPVIEDDLEKIDDLMDQLDGFKWFKIGEINLDKIKGIEEIYLNNRSILILSDGEKLKAVDKACQKCNTMIHFLAYDKKVKCFQCEEEYSLEQNAGELKLTYYRTKQMEQTLFIAMK